MELVLAALPVETTGALLRTGATAERAAILRADKSEATNADATLSSQEARISRLRTLEARGVFLTDRRTIFRGEQKDARVFRKPTRAAREPKVETDVRAEKNLARMPRAFRLDRDWSRTDPAARSTNRCSLFHMRLSKTKRGSPGFRFASLHRERINHVARAVLKP